MSNDILGTVTLERLTKAVARDPQNHTYNSLLLDRYLSNQMRDLACTGKINGADILEALKLFGVGFCLSSETEGQIQFENYAVIDKEKHTVSWYTCINEGLNNVGRKYTVIGPGGVRVEKVMFKRPKKTRNRKSFSSLPPELKEKLRKRYPNKVY